MICNSMDIYTLKHVLTHTNTQSFINLGPRYGHMPVISALKGYGKNMSSTPARVTVKLSQNNNRKEGKDI